MEKLKNRILSNLTSLLIFSSLMLCISCNEEKIDFSDPSQVINSISTAWGSSPDEIRKHMEGYSVVQDNDGKTLIYKDESSDNFVSYRFINNKLAASLFIIRNNNAATDYGDYLRSYQYVGNINNDMVYQDKSTNNVALIKINSEENDFSSIAFTPLISDEYEKAEPYAVYTDEVISIESTKVTLHGKLTGVEKEAEVGFMVSLSPNMDEANSRVTNTKSSGGKFESVLNGIAGQETYYYRAYAVIDEMQYYGEVRSFETPPLTYTVNGKEFQVIKIEGSPYGTISMLQTEISVSDKVTFAGVDLGMTLDCDVVDEKISLYEYKKFLGNFMKLTGLAWRVPTSAEWKFASSGGLFSNSYTYSGSDDINKVAWYKDNCKTPMAPGLKQSNELGIYDMSGNYAELTNDNSIKDLESNDFMSSSYVQWTNNGTKACGGSWISSASQCKYNSQEAVVFLDNKNSLIDGKKYCLRLIFSHHIKSYYPY